jgi:hypothetical protein
MIATIVSDAEERNSTTLTNERVGDGGFPATIGDMGTTALGSVAVGLIASRQMAAIPPSVPESRPSGIGPTAVSNYSP